MPRGSKSKYTDKQKRQAEHIEDSYRERGVPQDEAEARAWATVNKMTGGGKKSGAGRGKEVDPSPARKGGKRAAPPRPGAARRNVAHRRRRLQKHAPAMPPPARQRPEAG